MFPKSGKIEYLMVKNKCIGQIPSLNVEFLRSCDKTRRQQYMDITFVFCCFNTHETMSLFDTSAQSPEIDSFLRLFVPVCFRM